MDMHTYIRFPFTSSLHDLTHLIQRFPTQFVRRRGWLILTPMLVMSVSASVLLALPVTPIYQAALVLQMPAYPEATTTQTMMQNTDSNFYASFFASPTVLQNVLSRHADIQIAYLQRYVNIHAIPGTSMLLLTAPGTTPQQAASIVEDIYTVALSDADTPGRSQLVGNLSKILRAELRQVRMREANTANNLRSLKAQQLVSAPVYLQLDSVDREQQHLITTINTQLSELHQRLHTALLKRVSRSPRITTIPGTPLLPGSAPALAALLGLIIGAAGARVVDRYTDPLLRKKPLPSHLPTVPELVEVTRNPLQVLEQTLPCLPLLQQIQQQPAQLITVTSVNTGEGKSIVATGLALAAARNNLRTVLIDANHQQPVLHTWFQLPATPGAWDALRDFTSDTTCSAAILPPTGQLLRVIPIGNTLPATQEYDEALPIKGLRPFIELLRLQTDIIIIDGPALSSGGNALHLAHLSDITLLVTDTHKRSLTGENRAQAEKLFATIEAPFMTIFNRCEHKKNASEPASQPVDNDPG